MKSWIVVVAVALIPVGAVSFGAFVDEAPAPKAVMTKLFKGAKAQSKVLDGQVKATPTDWEAIQKTTKEFATLGSTLEKAEPEKGSKESWKTLASKFGENTKALHDAAEAKDLEKVKATQKAIGGSCKSCHDSHRGK
jgi:cytochrome c556